jgi:CRISPR/Cas system-associated exonuclease Cas4 (RecB family)
MPPTLTTLSQSSLQDYVDCPRRFQLRYLERLSYPAVESEPALENEKHIEEGEYFHRLMQQYWVGIPAEQISKLANTENLRKWWENFLNSKDLTNLRAANRSNLYTEASLSAPLGDFRLLAKYDLLVIENTKATIYDWKTYRKRPRDEWLSARMQTRVYRALLVRAGAHLNHGQPFDNLRTAPFAPEQIEMVYWFSDFPNDPARFVYTSAQYQRDWDVLIKLADEIKTASNYLLTDDRTKCLYCSYRSYCERGVGAGDIDQAEAEMESEELFDVNFEQIGEIEF